MTNTARGYVKGEPRRFMHGHHGRALQTARARSTPGLATDHAWAAGILDGEGCIQIRRSRLGHTLYVTVGQSSRSESPMLERLVALYGGRIHEHRKSNPDPTRKPHFVWGVVSRQAEEMLRQIDPYVVEKRNQVALALRYREQAVGPGRFDLATEYRRQLRVLREQR